MADKEERSWLPKRYKNHVRIGGLLGAFAFAMFAMAYIQGGSNAKKIPLDANLCPADKTQIQDYAAVVLDVSEPLKGNNAEQLITQVFELAKTLPVHSNLVVFDALEVTTGNKFVVSRCISEELGDCRGGAGMKLTKNCNIIVKKHHDKFEVPLEEELKEFLSGQEVSKSSPVIESISSVAALTEFKNAEARKIYIFSDMLQNMKGYSHYRAGMSEDEFDQLVQRVYYNEVEPDLLDADVNVFYILRKKNRLMQSSAHRKFWQDFFVSANARQPVEFTDWNFAGDTASSSAGAEINLEDASATPENLLPGRRRSRVDDHALQYPDLSKGAYPAKDIVLVLDNSGSMRHNDPDFLLKKAVTNFVEHQGISDRISIMKFDQKVDVLVSLDDGFQGQRAVMAANLQQIDYRGQLTDSPAAIERAVYELRENGMSGVNRIIIFMTDGIIDTGNVDRDLVRGQWLQEELMLVAAKSGIRIFGIAFGESADFQLLHSITRQTGGEYYRASKAEELNKVLIKITIAINEAKQTRI